MKKYIGVDLGGTNLRVGLVSQDGEILDIYRRKAEVEKGPAFVVHNMVKMIREILHNTPSGAIDGIGMAIPGLLDTGKGLIRFAPNLKWYDVPILQMIQEKIDIPVYFDNDCRVHALGEYYYGAGKGLHSFMVIALGTGIGSGIILNGHLYRGSFECAGEIGHFQIQDPGAKCSCGKYGCLETVASATGIVRMANTAIQEGRGRGILELAGKRDGEVTCMDVFDAQEKGDRDAERIIQEVARCLSIAISMFYNTLNLEAVIISGGVSKAGERLLGPVREKVGNMAQRSIGPYKDMLNTKGILPAKLGDDAGLIGGAALVQYRMMEKGEERKQNCFRME